jgi:CubicO group peptidase (beta-lactamase class C family)
VGGGLITAVGGGTIAGVSTALRELLVRHVDAGTIPGGVAVLGAGNAEVVTAGVMSLGGGPMGEDAIMRIQSMTKAITSVAALRLVEAGRLELDQSLVDWLPELADRRVLRVPAAELGDTVPARRAITLRHLLTNTCGYGMVLQASPLQSAMSANGTEAGPEPPAMGADEWLRRLTELPLAFQPGEGWRYHHSFGVLGILISRVTGRPLGEHLAEDIFGPLGMADTALWVAEGKLDRLPAAYRHGDGGLVEIEPAGGGFYAGPPSFDVSHGELVSTARDYRRFARMLAEGGRVNSQAMISPEHLQQMTSDQVPTECKTADSFFPGFWDGMGWGFGVAVQTEGSQRGRIGWAGGLGTDFFADPDGTVGVLLTQVEMGETMSPLVEQFQSVHEPS